MLEVTAESPPLMPQFTSRQRISFEDFLVQYDGQFAEWIDGEVIKTKSPSNKHQDLLGFLLSILGVFIEENDLGKIISASMIMKLTKEKRGREPDLPFVSKNYLHRLKKIISTARLIS